MAKKKKARKPQSKPRPKKKPAARKRPVAKKLTKKKRPVKKSPARAKAAVKAAPPAPPPPKPGSFIWHELATANASGAKSFYGKLFGWTSADQEMMPGFMYTRFRNKGQDIGGMMQIAPEQGNIKPHWMLYVLVKDVDASAQMAEAMGGEIVIPPHDIPVGRWAALTDPDGAAFSIFKPSKKSMQEARSKQ